jgi:transcriptional antiterminator RfaH
MQAHWYVIQSKPRQEVKACEELQKQGYEVYLPIILIDKVVDGQRVEKEGPLFSRYLFVCLNETTSNWAPIRSTKGVSQMIRFGSHIPHLNQGEYSTLKKWVLGLPKKDCFKLGQVMNLVSGPFNGMEVIFEKIVQAKDGQERALVMFEFLGKCNRIQAPLSDLALLA